MLEEIQANMLEKARRFREENTAYTDDYPEFKKIIEEKRGFIVSRWCGGSDCGAKSGTVAYFVRAY